MANPRKTCQFRVERRDNFLHLQFLADDGKNLFAEAFTDASTVPKGKNLLQTWCEPVVDSSRYFVTKILGAGGREAMIGFGFRDRDAAVDLREALLFMEKSMERESQAASLHSFSVPVMGKDQKIHVNTGKGKKSKIVSEAKAGGTQGGAIPLLKKKPPPSALLTKKPPPSADEAGNKSAQIETGERDIDEITVDMGDIDLDARPGRSDGTDDASGGDGSSSGGAVYEGDEEQWATEFSTK